METPEWKKFAEEWYIRPDSYQGPDFPRGWTTRSTLERFVKEFGLRQ